MSTITIQRQLTYTRRLPRVTSGALPQSSEEWSEYVSPSVRPNRNPDCAPNFGGAPPDRRNRPPVLDPKTDRSVVSDSADNDLHLPMKLSPRARDETLELGAICSSHCLGSSAAHPQTGCGRHPPRVPRYLQKERPPMESVCLHDPRPRRHFVYERKH